MLEIIPKPLNRGIKQTGSSVICNPPVLDTDRDYICCVTSFKEAKVLLDKVGFKASTHDEAEYDIQEDGLFICYRKDDINLILTEDIDFYLKWCRATDLATKLNLLAKEQRITLFKYILYDIL